MTQIKSVAELRVLDPEEIKIHKREIRRAKLTAATDLDREPYVKQLECIDKILNEKETADQERGFLQLKQDIDETTKYALAVEATI
jgi:hypothetical protein